jgi:hypothetical protein
MLLATFLHLAMFTTVEKPKLTTAECNTKVEDAILDFQEGGVSTIAEAARQHAVFEATFHERLIE